MATRELLYVGDGGALPGIPAADLVLDDGDKSHERYGDQVAAGEQHKPPVLIPQRQIERLGFASAAAMADALAASELYDAPGAVEAEPEPLDAATTEDGGTA